MNTTAKCKIHCTLELLQGILVYNYKMYIPIHDQMFVELRITLLPHYWLFLNPDLVYDKFYVISLCLICLDRQLKQFRCLTLMKKK
jgi:hypothetical protein